MSLFSRLGFRSLQLAANPPTPAAGQRVLFAKSDAWYEITPSGAVGRVAPIEVFVQAASPTQGTTPWVWYEIDGANGLTGNEYVWTP